MKFNCDLKAYNYGVTYLSFMLGLYINLAMSDKLLTSISGSFRCNKLLAKFEQTLINRNFSDGRKTLLIVENLSIAEYHYHCQTFSHPIYLYAIKKSIDVNDSKLKKVQYRPVSGNVLAERWPVGKIIIDEYDIKYLKLVLYELKNTVWWNSNSFVLVKNTLTPGSCIFAILILEILWEFKIPSAVFLCLNVRFEVSVYTLNPYSDVAPKFWRKTGSYKEANGRSATVFKNRNQISAGSQLVLEDLWFDKTQNLKNYPVRIASQAYFGNPYKKIKREVIILAQQKLVELIFMCLGTNNTFVPYLSSGYGKIDNQGFASGIVADVLGGKYDIDDVPNYSRGLWRNELNTFHEGGLCIITRKKRLPILEQLSNVFPPEVRIKLLITYLGVVMIFWFMLKVGCITLFFDVLRAIFGSQMINHPHTSANRLIFICFIFMSMGFNFYLQGQLNSMLTIVTTKNSLIKSVTSLSGLNYKVYTRSSILEFLQNTSLNDSVMVQDLFECLSYLKSRNNVACLESCRVTKFFTTEDDYFSITEDNNFEPWIVYLLTEDSPLNIRICIIYMRLFQHGFSHYWIDMESITYKRRKLAGSKKISLNQFKSVFYTFIILNILSTLIFLFEIVAKKLSI